MGTSPILRSRFVRIVLVLAVAIAILYAAPMFFEERLIFFPEAQLLATPKDHGLDYEDVWLDADGARCHAWCIRSPAPRAMMLYFHGNAGNISGRIDHAAEFAKRSLDVLLVSYPGYGRSEGRPSKDSLNAAADAAWSWAARNVPNLPVVIFGESLGGAVAIDLASRREPAALITQSTFTSIKHMAKVAFPFLPFVPPLRNNFDSIEKIRHIRAPKLLLHGDVDEVVPFAQGEVLAAAAQQPKTFVPLRGAAHNDTWIAQREAYFQAVDTFLAGL